MGLRILRQKPKLWRSGGIDILVTHAPARHINDFETLTHRGFECFVRLLDQYRPKYFVHGHTPDEVRTFDESPEFERAVREKSAAAGKTELLEHLIDAPVENRRTNRIYWESCDSRDYRKALKRIDVPTGLFFADPGSLYSPKIAEWIAERVPDTTIYLFHGCTHLASGEKPLEFIEAIADFSKKSGKEKGVLPA